MRLLESEVKCMQRILIHCFKKINAFHLYAVFFATKNRGGCVLSESGGVRLVTRLSLAY